MPDYSTSINLVLKNLQHSAFRKKFYLHDKDKAYLYQKGKDVISQHAFDFIQHRLAPAFPARDGKQTPWKKGTPFLLPNTLRLPVVVPACKNGTISPKDNP